MKKNMKIITSTIIVVGVFLAPLFTDYTTKTELIYEWQNLNTSLSASTWELDESCDEINTENDVIEIHKVVVINQSKTFKSYMPYDSITAKSSKQYKIRQLAFTSEYGLRKFEDRFCVAVGTSITSEVGTYIDVILKNGTVIPCIVGDVKADIHTNSDNITTSNNGCVCEFIVDMNQLPYVVRNKDNTGSGNISHCYEEWMSPVEKIIVYERSVFDE